MRRSSPGAFHARAVRRSDCFFAAIVGLWRPRGACERERVAMIAVLHFVALAGFAGLMAVAAFEDFRRFTIPNWLTLGLCALWPLSLVAGPGLSDTLAALGCALVVFLIGAILFARGYI